MKPSSRSAITPTVAGIYKDRPHRIEERLFKILLHLQGKGLNKGVAVELPAVVGRFVPVKLVRSRLQDAATVLTTCASSLTKPLPRISALGAGRLSCGASGSI